ncbi:putative phage head-tail adaptor [Vitreoscilla sp. C1]|uniref:phage head closure protein n=1 Tax=Vitreoscilla sp. (strain C1) TaxID=96942 RepID=UPI000CDC5FFC|nr:phage head closure protein [Vitreoscilla sp. C1]AUZ06353.1 putative phage head-tail adaptor [Vitreoscilla sp. C1]
MQAGKLNQIITIESSAEVKDVFGGVSFQWTQVCRPYCHVRFINGREFAKQGIQLAELTVSFRIRQRKGIDHLMRVKFDGEIYQIIAVLPDAQGKAYMDLACKKWIEHES